MSEFKDKTCIKRKHVFLGSLLAYPIGYVLYSWYYWFTHLHLVEYYRNYFVNQYNYREISLWNYFEYPFYDTSQNYNIVFFISVHFILTYLIIFGLSSIYKTKFMNKCLVKKKEGDGVK